MLPVVLAAVLLVVLTVLIHYEVLGITSSVLPRLYWIPRRPRLIVVVLAAFAAHTVEVWLWGVGYYVLVDVLQLGTFGGEHSASVLDSVYFSAVSYTSLGIGDVYPRDGLRLLTGVEALVGLLMIAWSASFTYLSMERFWQDSGRR